jgi:hypothetical protein
MKAKAAHQLRDLCFEPLRAAHQMNSQRHSYGHSPNHSDQYRRGRTILHNADTRVNLRMQMIRQMLYRGIQQLSHQHRGARQKHQPPPQRLRPQDQHCDHHRAEDANLNPDAVLATHCMR